MANTYDIGDVVLAVAEFRNASNSLVDPDTVSARTYSPSGSTTTYIYGVDAVLTKLATGRYQLSLEPAASGPWYYKFFGTGTNKGAGESFFNVRASFFS